jgi:hypothetical protein
VRDAECEVAGWGGAVADYKGRRGYVDPTVEPGIGWCTDWTSRSCDYRASLFDTFFFAYIVTFALLPTCRLLIIDTH